MFRTACLSIVRLSFVLGMALAVFGAMSPPASAQGTVRGHGEPPAPKPTVDRDQRRGAPETEAVQWEIRDDKARSCEQYMLANVRRDGLSMPRMLTPVGTGKETTWSADGGNWSFEFVKTIAGETLLRCGILGPGINDWMALRSWKTGGGGGWLGNDLKMAGRMPSIWTLKGRKVVEREGVKYLRFAIFNEQLKRYLMLCHDEADKKKNNQALCLYDAIVPG